MLMKQPCPPSPAWRAWLESCWRAVPMQQAGQEPCPGQTVIIPFPEIFSKPEYKVSCLMCRPQELVCELILQKEASQEGTRSLLSRFPSGLFSQMPTTQVSRLEKFWTSHSPQRKAVWAGFTFASRNFQRSLSSQRVSCYSSVSFVFHLFWLVKENFYPSTECLGGPGGRLGRKLKTSRRLYNLELLENSVKTWGLRGGVTGGWFPPNSSYQHGKNICGKIFTEQGTQNIT